MGSCCRLQSSGCEPRSSSGKAGWDGIYGYQYGLRPQFPYHGKVEAGKTLSELASTTLGWDASIWDFSGAMPTLK